MVKNILLIKTSSLGDVIHTFPALTDVYKKHPDVRFHWVVEEGFKSLPLWHPSVERVIPVAIRRWRKNVWQTWKSGEWQKFKQDLNKVKYDGVIDAQGLIKSACLTRAIHHRKELDIVGYDKMSAREPMASMFYSRKVAVEKEQHAVERTRQLFALAFNYPVLEGQGDYGLVSKAPPLIPTVDRDLKQKSLVQPSEGVSSTVPFQVKSPAENQSVLQKIEESPGFESLSYEQQRAKMLEVEPYALFLHGTTWSNKHWPDSYWIALAHKITHQGTPIRLLWGSEQEKQRAEMIQEVSPLIKVMPRLDLNGAAQVVANAKFIVAVDTGLSHIAAAFNVPTVSLYGPTSPGLTGSYGDSQIHLSTDFECAPCLKRQCFYDGPVDLEDQHRVEPPCFSKVDPNRVWSVITKEGWMTASGKK